MIAEQVDTFISDLDTANRRLNSKIQGELVNSKLKDKNGRPLSFFIYAKPTQNGFERDTRGYRVSTLAAAHDEYLVISKAQPHRRKQIYNEYLVRAENPYFMMSVPNEFSAREIADSLYAGGVLDRYEYNSILTKSGIDEPNYKGIAAKHINLALQEKGIDSIVYMNGTYDRGSMGVIVLSDTQLIPVSQNGVQNENFVENAGENGFDFDDASGYNEDDIITDGSHLKNRKLKPNVKYRTGEHEYIYSTDSLGRISKVQANDLQYTERDHRKKHNPNTPGKENGDHAGHLIGDRFGGSEDIDNLVSQSALVNMSEYRKIENQWARAIKNGQKVSVDIEVKYDGDSMRPVGFIVRYAINGKNYNEIIKN